MRHRIQGVLSEAASTLGGDDATDEVVVDRVRSKLGRYVSHPAFIEVSASNGRVTLQGAVLASEIERLLAAVSSVRGVKEVENRLEAHPHATNALGLQDGRTRLGERPEFLQTNWSPAMRLVSAALGGGLLVYGSTRRFPTACVLGTLGLGLFARAMSNARPRQVSGPDRKRRSDELGKQATSHAMESRQESVAPQG